MYSSKKQKGPAAYAKASACQRTIEPHRSVDRKGCQLTTQQGLEGEDVGAEDPVVRCASATISSHVRTSLHD